MSEPFLGQVQIWAGNFAPRGWAWCDGTILPIAQNTALFSLLGTIYGGDGRTTFGLPNLKDRMPIHAGRGPGLTPRTIGQVGGSPTETLTAAQMPSHRHNLAGTDEENTASTPIGKIPGTAEGDSLYRSASDTTMLPTALAETGGGGPHDNHQPSLGLSFIIALTGTYPSRS